MLNLTNLHRTYTPFNFFLVLCGSWYWWEGRSWKFQICLFVCFFMFCTAISIFGVSAPKMQRDVLRHGRHLWEEQNFVINHPTMFKTLFLKLLFTVESKSGIKMLVNLLLLDIICPKNATLFIRDQLQGIITSQPTVPPPLEINSLSIFLNDIQHNRKLCSVFWNIAFIWCSHSPLAEYWVHCVEYYYSVHANNFPRMVLEEQSCIFRANYLQK